MDDDLGDSTLVDRADAFDDTDLIRLDGADAEYDHTATGLMVVGASVGMDDDAVAAPPSPHRVRRATQPYRSPPRS